MTSAFDGGGRFDLFVSYKTRRFVDRASWLTERLSDLGYRVWFDRKVLDQKTGGRRDKDELIEILVSAVEAARCSVVFEAELEKVLLLPGMSEEDALRAKMAMKAEHGALVAWNWQKLEIDASANSVSIHPSSQRVFAHRDQRRLPPADGLRFADDEGMLDAVLECLDRLEIEPGEA